MGLIAEFPRGIQNCSSLNSLDLSSNRQHGTIPSNISKFIGFVVNLDLSSNQFSGEIPADIANCSFLNNIKLDNNKLEGTIPPEIGLLGRIKTFNVANNMLTVQVPIFLNATVPAESFANNPGLCGRPLELCVTENVGNGVKKTNRTLFISGFMTGWSLFTILGLYLCFFGLPGVKKMLLLIKKSTNAMKIDGNEWPDKGIEVNNDPKVNILLAFNHHSSF
ncbi:hypothetical protein HAX54_005761 [Datura stramonium]|uniref:Uncharacterized protein n=1 Tax=Datura stramonium TaxID=4076 RepID=A0ABS8T9A8_DATST|nr:hypothetical protein [Datura stramonium]